MKLLEHRREYNEPIQMPFVFLGVTITEDRNLRIKQGKYSLKMILMMNDESIMPFETKSGEKLGSISNGYFQKLYDTQSYHFHGN
jgi:hypothetical protein